MQEMLVSTLDYYCPDPKKRRGVDKDFRCVYSPTSTSEGCGIGRHLIGTPQQKLEWDKTKMNIKNIADTLPLRTCLLEDLRPDWMREMPIDFLIAIQRLHDRESHWNLLAGGLSRLGKEYVWMICEEFKINKRLVAKWVAIKQYQNPYEYVNIEGQVVYRPRKLEMA